ncbi:MAG TPA: YaiO family outer membrane beta-barrel protein [Burkholderiales bacterium]
MSRAVAVALLCLASAAGAEEATELEAGFTRERLTRGLPDWKSVSLEAVRQYHARAALYGSVRQSERFGERDAQLGGGGYLPLGASWTAQAEALYSPEHQVLPHSSLFAGLSRTLAGGWGASAGLRRNEYTRTAAHVLSLGAERYWDQWRAAYTLYSGRPEGSGSATAHRFQVDRYYAERSSVGASFVTGREVENTGPLGGILTSEVTGAELYARHWLTTHWALSAAALMHKQGDLYERRGVRLGIRYRF